MGDEPEWAEGTEETEDFDEGEVDAGEGHVDDGGGDDEEVEDVPGLAEVGAVVHDEAEGDGLGAGFEDEHDVEDDVDVV